MTVDMCNAMAARWALTSEDYDSLLNEAAFVDRPDLVEWAFSKGGRFGPKTFAGIATEGARTWMIRTVGLIRAYQPDFDFTHVRRHCAVQRERIDALEQALA